jgi:UDP-glucose 4-epimerase
VRILVTGVAGFIGSNTATLLVARGDSVVGVDNLSSGLASNVPAGVEFVEGDIADYELIRSLGIFDACIHFAGFIASGESMEIPEVYFANNVAATLEMLRALVDGGTGKVVFSSSAGVYGDVATLPIEEDAPTTPTSPYGESKLMIEQALRWFAQQGRLRAAALRYFNAAGGTSAHPEHHSQETHLIPLALAYANGDRDAFVLFGDDYPTSDGTCIRDYVHVLDLARAHILAIDALDNHNYLVCNLGTGRGFSNREVLDAVARVTGLTRQVATADRRPGDPAVLVASTARAERVLGWTAQHTQLDGIVADAWTAYQALAK